MLIAGCRSADPGGSWQAASGREHPLVGRVWDVGAARFLPPGAVADRLAGARFVLLGEKHDNPDHHRLQAFLLRAVIQAGRRPAVGFEMLTAADAPAIARHLGQAPRDAAGLGDAVNWKRSGWPDWSLYQPIAAAALDAGLPIVATNLAPATAQAMRRQGVAALPPALIARYGLDRALPPPVEAEMAAEIRAVHCDHAPESIVPGMIAVQRARDAQMADALAAAGEGDGAVLIAGAGHVRVDRGVPASLRAIQPAASIASLAFLEVEHGATAPAAYAAGFQREVLPFDYVWFTPRVDDIDPCEKFRRDLERLRRPPGALGDRRHRRATSLSE